MDYKVGQFVEQEYICLPEVSELNIIIPIVVIRRLAKGSK